MIFITQSGSTYEVNQEQKMVRRLNGKGDATPRQGKDGEWRPFKVMTPVLVGQSVAFVWPSTVPLLPGSEPDAVPATITSPVRSVLR